ncbi:efflux RND transporter periplasmic adaptor subunit [Halomonas vilamensis]|uniref:Efflux RND transporter periplasmic adaptor subunit n=1 Tax=Vreelandella vilamensis TaxID=531309 RepID=A0ABU1H0P0_9GAMM|nr:efflux RND transporter periplasmic adaptor subunit [Halomonas vilamensis]MDR5897863.1 efflux RND transporter periplasmic adaptor subunit [Halomonas vilamensis]
MSDTPNKRWKIWLSAAIVLISLIALAVWAVLSRKAELATAPGFTASPVAVHTVAAETGTLSLGLDYLAEAEATHTAEISTKVIETVQEVAVDEGDRVAAGGLLVRLDTSEIDARLNGVAADIRKASAEREAEQANQEALTYSVDHWTREVSRLRQLRNQRAVSQADLDAARNQLNQIEGQLEVSRQQLKALRAGLDALRARQEQLKSQRANYVLNAPFAGTVTARTIDPGDESAPGKMLIRLESLQTMRLVFGVPEEDRPSVEAGRTVDFFLSGTSHQATVNRINPALDAAGLARAEVDLAEGMALPPGAEIPVTVALPSLKAVLIPAGALAGGGEEPTVYVVIDGKAQARSVSVRRRDNKGQVAVSGVQSGEQVIVSPYLGWTRLSDGVSVTEIGQ